MMSILSGILTLFYGSLLEIRPYPTDFLVLYRAVASGASEGGKVHVWTWTARNAVGETAQRPSEAAGGAVSPPGGGGGLGAQLLENLRILCLLDAWKFHFQHLKRETSSAYIEEKIY